MSEKGYPLPHFEEAITKIEMKYMYAARPDTAMCVNQLIGVRTVLEEMDAAGDEVLQAAIDREIQGCNFLINLFETVHKLRLNRRVSLRRRRV
ncbi:hypothetical protein [Paenibacillus xylanexedens]|uniref:hypothetical protein n=1 Tax=Paenibacillus xylanexedens TaxID=528191 RepID=UPI0011A70532|nr:hypothetical protein [Paenibacillus xylanexedens]